MREMSHVSAGRRAVWSAMADLFLDCETRHEVPLVASLCLEHRFAIEQAFEIWRFEVTPAVCFNVYAWDWLPWDRPWLYRRIAGKRESWPRGFRWLGNLRYRTRLGSLHCCWTAIARHMELMQERPSARVEVAKQTYWLACHYFDESAPERPGRAEALRRLFEDRLEPVFAGMSVAAESREACRLRVAQALGGRSVG